MPEQPLGPQASAFQATPENEGSRLWAHALFGAGACVGMIEGYCRLSVPGAPVPAIQALVTRLQGVLQTIGKQESRTAAE